MGQSLIVSLSHLLSLRACLCCPCIFLLVFLMFFFTFSLFYVSNFPRCISHVFHIVFLTWPFPCWHLPPPASWNGNSWKISDTVSWDWGGTDDAISRLYSPWIAGVPHRTVARSLSTCFTCLLCRQRERGKEFYGENGKTKRFFLANCENRLTTPTPVPAQ